MYFFLGGGGIQHNHNWGPCPLVAAVLANSELLKIGRLDNSYDPKYYKNA